MSDLLSIFAAEVRKREAAASAQAHAASVSAPQPDPTPSPKSNPKDTESRRWVLTLPLSEYTQAEVEKRLGRYKAVVGQLEAAPTTGYLHWQLYL
ncbi:hypothetical protein P2A57_23605, partial [Xanthomonas perforans]